MDRRDARNHHDGKGDAKRDQRPEAGMALLAAPNRAPAVAPLADVIEDRVARRCRD
jgi:hypothetical protein